MTRLGRADRGGASVLLLAVGLVLVVAALFSATVAAARAARQQARVAADFGALAGATRALRGQDDACRRAAELVEANGGRLTGCRLDGLDLVVRVAVTVRPPPGLPRTAEVAARAGPTRG